MPAPNRSSFSWGTDGLSFMKSVKPSRKRNLIMRVANFFVCFVIALFVFSVCGCKTGSNSSPSGWASASWNPANWSLGKTNIGSTTPPDLPMPQKPSVCATPTTTPSISYPSTGARLVAPKVSYQDTTASYNSPAKDHGQSSISATASNKATSPSTPYMAPQNGYYTANTTSSTPAYQQNNPQTPATNSKGYVPETPAPRYASQSVADSRYNPAPKYPPAAPASQSYGNRASCQTNPADRYRSPTTSRPSSPYGTQTTSTPRTGYGGATTLTPSSSPPTRYSNPTTPSTNNYRHPNTASNAGISTQTYPSANQTTQDRFISRSSPGQESSSAIGDTNYPKTEGNPDVYTPGDTGYQPGNSRYQPGQTGYRPSATSSYQSPVGSYQPPKPYAPPASPTTAQLASPYRPGSTSNYTSPSSPVTYPSYPSTAVSTNPKIDSPTAVSRY